MISLDHAYYNKPINDFWRGRMDTLPNERFFQHVTCFDLLSTPLSAISQSICLMGFESEEGVLRNLGRPGAKEAPNVIRQQFAKLACHDYKAFADLGNIHCHSGDLEQAQQQLSHIVESCHRQNQFTIILGGGHEVAWPHYKGLLPNYPKLGVINFDAHFDLRPLIDGTKGSSGTGFLQMAHACEQDNRSFDYCCLGIQKQANTPELMQTADELGVSYVTANDIHTNSDAWVSAFVDEFILNQDVIYITLCMDVFAEAFAPGVSAPQPTGLTPWQVMTLLKYIFQTGKVVALDFAEVSPPLDQGDKTARLAAVLLAELFSFL